MRRRLDPDAASRELLLITTAARPKGRRRPAGRARPRFRGDRRDRPSGSAALVHGAGTGDLGPAAIDGVPLREGPSGWFPEVVRRDHRRRRCPSRGGPLTCSRSSGGVPHPTTVERHVVHDGDTTNGPGTVRAMPGGRTCTDAGTSAPGRMPRASAVGSWNGDSRVTGRTSVVTPSVPRVDV